MVPQTRLRVIRSTYWMDWIPNARHHIRSLLRNCFRCKLFQGKPYKYPSQPPLPSFRLTRNFAFTNVGIDYAGSVFIKDVYNVDKTSYKAWIALITCASTRAIYLDIATNYTGTACVNVLRRFFNRKG